ncbi:15-hydroxyprostaglandin dehydrogenase [NAD(+)] [Cytospora mali]|uniref:15-hydroxyprostaglandin dehydrogenase [NAD(+)] n=1 Tax=Cytospora mali TaxID=578113 RepID=A0A194W5F9_CYTMA|nr:15-hydroxyprostaglandin dehydrogenase [NAD(+)] [Valsa mali]
MMTTTTSFTPFSVSGKTAIVTGAGSGINLAFAALLLSRDCNVVLADLALRPEAEALVARHSDAGKSPRAVFVKTDVTSWPSLSKMFDVTLAEFGDIDVVCPGAGVYEPHWTNFWHPPGSRESKDAIDGEPGHYSLLDINLTHPIRATQLAISHWLHPPSSSPRVKVSSSNPKRIVHISSVAGQMPNINAPIYSASKFAITGFVRSLADLDEKHGIRVNAVAPGVVRTPLWLEHPEKMVNIDPERDGWVTPDECAVAMLRCVEEGDLVGGTILEVGKDNTRCVGCLNDPGPSPDPKDGLVSRNLKDGTDMVWTWLEDESIWGPGRTS